MSDEQEKQRLWKLYMIFMGVMVGGGALILSVQWMFGAIQNSMRQTLDQVNKSSSNAQQEILQKTQQTQENSATNQNSIKPELMISQAFSEEDAKFLVKRYLDAKPNIFAPPFNRQIVEEITTGELRKDIINAISWMEKNNAYYRYDFLDVGSTEKIEYSNDKAIAELRVIEKFSYFQNGILDPSKSYHYGRVYRWNFQKENGVWKISDYTFKKEIK